MGHPHVLVVEDDQLLLQLWTTVLRHEGFDVTAAHDGAQAIRLLGAVRPDVVLTDFLLPEADGLDVCRRVRSDPTLATVPILLLTASEPDVGRVREALALPGVRLGRKPVSVRRLGQLVRELMEKPRD